MSNEDHQWRKNDKVKNRKQTLIVCLIDFILIGFPHSSFVLPLGYNNYFAENPYAPNIGVEAAYSGNVR